MFASRDFLQLHTTQTNLWFKTLYLKANSIAGSATEGIVFKVPGLYGMTNQGQ